MDESAGTPSERCSLSSENTIIGSEHAFQCRENALFRREPYWLKAQGTASARAMSVDAEDELRNLAKVCKLISWLVGIFADGVHESDCVREAESGGAKIGCRDLS